MLSISSDNLLEVLNLYDVTTSSYVTDATVTARVKDSTGALLFTVPLTYTGPLGNYRGVLVHSLAATLTESDSYFIDYESDSATGLTVLVHRETHVAYYA